MPAKKQGLPAVLRRDEVRGEIDVRAIINLLQNNILKETKAPPLDQNKIRCAEILLKKALPDITAIELTGQDNEPIRVSWGKRR